MEIPTAIAISPRGDLVLTPAEKLALVKAKLCRLPLSIFREMVTPTPSVPANLPMGLPHP